MSSEGRVVLVTGASMGLGKCIAAQFVANGDLVVGVARAAEPLKAAASAIGFEAIACDVASPEALAALMSAISARHGPVEVLVNNAGIHGPVGPLAEADPSEWEEALKIDLLAPFRLMQAVIPAMVRKGTGAIINISGGGATKPMPSFSAYAAAKAGLVRLTETVALELEGSGVRVNAVAPGFLATRLHEPTLAGTVAVDPKIAETTRRNFARGGDDPMLAARLCVWLSGPEAAHINGRLLSAVFDSLEVLGSAEAFASKDLFTLRRVDNMLVFDAGGRLSSPRPL
jgi:NAD(P)-dependent dehydrogenase (short-subunit alcohol dehydrogenase family)